MKYPYSRQSFDNRNCTGLVCIFFFKIRQGDFEQMLEHTSLYSTLPKLAATDLKQKLAHHKFMDLHLIIGCVRKDGVNLRLCGISTMRMHVF